MTDFYPTPDTKVSQSEWQRGETVNATLEQEKKLNKNLMYNIITCKIFKKGNVVNKLLLPILLIVLEMLVIPHLHKPQFRLSTVIRV